jgi:hypothetical protein
MLHPALAGHLTADDDPVLWDIATNTLLAEAADLSVGGQEEVYAQVGCCLHWISPHHPIRWAADGGFAWPFGYDKTTKGFSYRALPELCWSEFLRWTGEGWELGRTGRRCLVLRVAIPGRTARRSQAAVHTVWTPHSPRTKEKMVRLYGFRKRDGEWSLTATETLKPRQRPAPRRKHRP